MQFLHFRHVYIDWNQPETSNAEMSHEGLSIQREYDAGSLLDTN